MSGVLAAVVQCFHAVTSTPSVERPTTWSQVVEGYHSDSSQAFSFSRRAAELEGANRGLGGHLVHIDKLFTLHQKLSIQGVSIAASTLSFAACLVSLYWFSLLQRNFRRTYVAPNFAARLSVLSLATD